MTRRQQRLCRKFALVTAMGAAVATGAGAGSADSGRTKERQTCAAAYEKAQELKSNWKLLRAKAALLSCARPVCGSFLLRECTTALAHLDAEIPSIVLSAKDESGAPLVDVGVTMDGEAFTSRADGRALSIDPGLHLFTFKSSGRPLETLKVPVAQGERNHLVSVAFRKSKHEMKAAASSADRPPPDEPSKPAKADRLKPERVANLVVDTAVGSRAVETPERAARARDVAPVATATTTNVSAPVDPTNHDSGAQSGGGVVGPYLLGALGIAGIGGFAVLHTMARAENGHLPECWPSCPESRLNEVRRLYTAANVSLVGGAVALGSAVGWLYFSMKSDGARSASSATSYAVSVEPRPAGMFASVAGVF